MTGSIKIILAVGVGALLWVLAIGTVSASESIVSFIGVGFGSSDWGASSSDIEPILDSGPPNLLHR